MGKAAPAQWETEQLEPSLGPQGGAEPIFPRWLELLRPSVLQAGDGAAGSPASWPGPGLGPTLASLTFLLNVATEEHEFPGPPSQGHTQPSDKLRQGSWCRSPDGPTKGFLSSCSPPPYSPCTFPPHPRVFLRRFLVSLSWGRLRRRGLSPSGLGAPSWPSFTRHCAAPSPRPPSPSEVMTTLHIALVSICL